MKKLLFIFCLLIFNFIIYANEPIFILNKDTVLTNGNLKEHSFSKDDEFIFKKSQKGIWLEMDDASEACISLYSLIDNARYKTHIADVKLADYSLKINETISKPLWIPSYYYDALKSSKPKEVLLKNETYWKNKIIYSRDLDLTWESEFGVLKYCFGDFYFIAFGRFRGYNQVDFFAYLEEVSAEKVVYSVQQMYSKSFNYQEFIIDNSNQPEFLPLYERETPFKIIFTIDGDYMYMYIDEVSDKNLFQTLVRTTSEACDQIENYILGKSKNLSSVVMPKHGTSTKSTNVSNSKTMVVKENLKLRSAEAISSQVLTVMSAGTKVKILELGKEETIDNINSNWVKVEIISGKDRDGNKLKSGMTGWCYGGYLQ